MKKLVMLVLLCSFPWILFSQVNLEFNDYFHDKTMRIDYFHVGDAKEEFITIDQIYQQGTWAGSQKNLIDYFNNGKYEIKVYNIASNQLIYSRGFATYFGEYTTTDPAIQGIKRTYHETMLIPFPKRPILLVLGSRNKQNILEPIFSTRIDPHDYHIIRENVRATAQVYEALRNGDPHTHVDLAWIAEGYSAKEFDKFKADVDRFIKVFFEVEPYKSHQPKFNIYGVFQPSSESGVDQPREGNYKSTALNSSFNALDLDRYLLTEDNKALRDIAASVPYDAIVIMVNSERYGGGGIYNFYALSTVDNSLSENVFLHEFGHSFAGLGDEYYSSDVAYNDFYPKGIEPTDPNITALLDPQNIKWKDLLAPGISVPTDWGKEKIEKLQADLQSHYKEMTEKIAQLKAKSASEKEIEKVREKYNKASKEITDKIKQVRADYGHLKGKVGAYEGAGYSATGLYRPEIDCMMFGNQQKAFCRICQRAIERMINFYSE